MLTKNKNLGDFNHEIFRSCFEITTVISNPWLLAEMTSLDQRDLKLLLENHILNLKVTLSEMYTGQQLETLSGKFIRVFIYRTVSTMDVNTVASNNKIKQQGSNQCTVLTLAASFVHILCSVMDCNQSKR